MVGDFSRVDAADDQAQPGTALLSHPGFQSIFTRRTPLHYTTVEMCALSEECENISVMCVFCWEVDKCDQVMLFSSDICTKAIRIG